MISYLHSQVIIATRFIPLFLVIKSGGGRGFNEIVHLGTRQKVIGGAAFLELFAEFFTARVKSVALKLQR